MKKGLLYGAVAWVLSLVLMPFLAPLIFHGGNMESLGRAWVPVSFVIIGIPAFLVGYVKERKAG